MKIWYISESGHPEWMKKSAGVKARDDAEEIFRRRFDAINIKYIERKNLSFLYKILEHFRTAGEWRRGLDMAGTGDIVFIQYPFQVHSIFLPLLFMSLKLKKIKTIALVHDIDSIRNGDQPLKIRARYRLEESSLRIFDFLIVHNDTMSSIMENAGISRKKLIPLGIFDYLVDGPYRPSRERTKDMPIIIAGMLARPKSGYIYDFPKEIGLNLYGINYEGSDNKYIDYKGAYEPDELPDIMEGSFGLVWDGESIHKCSGLFGRYMRMNNPHKTSLYLAAGIPVITWKKAAVSSYIENEGCGFTVKSLGELGKYLAALTDDDYMKMKENAITAGEKIRSGYYLDTAITKAVKKARINGRSLCENS